MQIISPSNGAIVAGGSMLTVVVSLTAGTNFSNVAVLGEDVGDYDYPNSIGTSSSLTFTINIPNGLAGPKKLTAIGLDSQNNIQFSSSIIVDIEPTAALTTLSVTPAVRFFYYPGEQGQLTVAGGFSDGTVIDLTRSFQTTFTSSDPAVATVDANGLITAVGQGVLNKTTILVKNSGLSATVAISIPKTIPGDLDGDGDVDQDDLNVILSYLNTLATGPFDARDLNHDGFIDLLDAQALVPLCGKPCPFPVQ